MNPMVWAIGGGGNLPSNTSLRISRPLRPAAAWGTMKGSSHVTVRVRFIPVFISNLALT